ncbi:MAG: hypothetical protein MJ252_06050, partial [archaeon]|nr:hypothetical protein [archaeon]
YYRSDAYYNYYLVGVVIHVGSADSGHYYSYINTIRGGKGDIADYDENDKNMDNCWLEYNDSNISKFNLEKLNEECFGGSTQQENNGTGYFWGATENCKNAYLLVYERKIKMPLKIIIKESKIEQKIKQGMKIIEINNSNERSIIKKRFDLLRYYGTEEYKTKCNEIYSSIFHDIEQNEYYIYKPFYFQKKKVPKKYYNEILKDNLNFDKKQNISDKDFINFISEIISVLERTLMNNININEDSIKNISKTYLDFMFNILTKKDKIEFLKESKDKLINIVSTIPKFQEYIWEYFLNNPIVLNTIINENTEVVNQISQLVIELIDKAYNSNKEEFNKYFSNEINTNTEISLYNNIHSFILSLLNRFPAIENKYLSHIESILILFYKLYLLSPNISVFYRENEFIPKMITFLIGKESPYYNKTIINQSNWDYGMRNDIPGSNNIIDIIYDITKQSKLVLKEDGIILTDDDISCICSPVYLKYVFNKNEEHFENLLEMLSKDNLEFSIFSAAELLKNMDNLNVYHSKEELISVIKCCHKLMLIKDEYQPIRLEILLGIPQHEIKITRRAGILPLIGYHSITTNSQTLFNNIPPIFRSENIKTVLGKLTEIRSMMRIGGEIFISLLKSCLDDHLLFKYLSLLPYESLEYKNYIDWGTHLIDNLGESEEDNKLKSELISISEPLNKLYSESILENEKLSKEYPGFICPYLLSTVKYCRISKVFEESNITLLLIDYYCDYMNKEEEGGIDFSKSQSNYNVYNYNTAPDRGEIIQEENFNEEDLEKEGILLLNSDSYGSYGEEKFMKDIKNVFNSQQPNAIIVENQYSVPNNKNILRRIIAINSALEETYICLKFKRQNEEEVPNEYLPSAPIIFKISYNEAKEIFNVSKIDVNKNWTFDMGDITAEISNNPFYNVEFPTAKYAGWYNH